MTWSVISGQSLRITIHHLGGFSGYANINMPDAHNYFSWGVAGERMTLFRVLFETPTYLLTEVEFDVLAQGHFLEELALHEIVNHKDTSCPSIQRGTW